jgi:hypothetical protein
MAKPPVRDLMGYDALTQDALRGVVKAALRRAASPAGLPGDHHLYISFRTDAAGVIGPRSLLEHYPDGMKIVLQNQFWDLEPGDGAFSVTLRFGGQPQNLTIPYAAITLFEDPSVGFRLEFGPGEGAAETAASAPAPARPAAAPAKSTGGDEPKVVSLDQFRKK